MCRHKSTMRFFFSSLVAAIVSLSAVGSASAAPPFVERRQTLTPRTYAFDGAFGLGKYDDGPGVSGMGAGANVELAAGVKEHIELGFALGMRYGTDGKRGAADDYAKLVDWRTFGRDGDRAFLPEVRFKSEVLDLPVVELSLELRAGLSVADVPPGSVAVGTTRPSIRLGAPVSAHIGTIARVDSGAFVRLVFANDTRSGILFPLELWFQPTNRIFVGPHGGILLSSPGGNASFQLGLGGGYQIAESVDLKGQLLAPAVNDGLSHWGVGLGVQLRVE